MIHKAKRMAHGAKRLKRGKISVSLCLIFTLCAMRYAPCAYAETIESKYLSISFCDNCSLPDFAQKINAASLFRLDALAAGDYDIRLVIKESVDALFLEVCDVLGISLKSYQGKLIVYPDTAEVSKAAYGNSQIIEANLPSIYVPDYNTIYISIRDLTCGMLAHEMAHAAISSYFVVAPPPKVQEILAGYVEYSIRKKTGSLP